MNSLTGMTIILSIFCVLLGGLRLWQRKFNPDPEVVRKFFHLGMGCFTLIIPWLLESVFCALLLGGGMIFLLVALRKIAALHRRFGAVLGSVKRISYGEIFFALAITLQFCWARNSILLYTIPILIMTFADALAALLGGRLGRHRYHTVEGEKSIEGSLAFLITAITVTFLPLIILAGLALSHALLIAMTLALPLTLIEALSWRGLDNLLVPVAAYLVLNELLFLSVPELRLILIVMTTIGTAVFVEWKERNMYVATQLRLS